MFDIPPPSCRVVLAESSGAVFFVCPEFFLWSVAEVSHDGLPCLLEYTEGLPGLGPPTLPSGDTQDQADPSLP